MSEYAPDKCEPTTRPEDWLANAETSSVDYTSPSFKAGYAEGYKEGYEGGVLAGEGRVRGQERAEWIARIKEMLNKEAQAFWGIDDEEHGENVPLFMERVEREGHEFTEEDVKRLYDQTTRGKMA